MVTGLSHMSFIAQDLDRMEEVLTQVLDARKIYDSGEETFSLSPERFYNIAGLWVAVMQGEPLPSRTYNHIAFKIDETDFDAKRAAIERLDLDLRESRPRVPGEGRSLYFHDHDTHLFELHTGTLETGLTRYAKGQKETP
ncbi:FosX/FosE/FosI family fosfomycin resistance hydrolase [Pseudaestuariivita sp.]|uniref:FosX/FosE/FosI family fosfomycin resistance hydrolase n=1 Tax=Pseudaestuariivita sp. TaxID=2211669 RepID=UPI004057FFAC